MASGENARTWACVQCTYLNYHKATKCAICQRLRLIEDDLIIVKDGRLNSPAPSTSTTHDTDKWACHLCTYLNYPKTQRCATCRTPRHENTASTSATVTLPRDVPRVRTPDPHMASTSASSEGASERSSLAQKLNQWSCAVCTYDNWPKAQKCVMCHTPRCAEKGRSISCSPPLGSKRTHEDEQPSSTRKSPRNSPPEPATPTQCERHDDSDPPTAHDDGEEAAETRRQVRALRGKHHDQFLFIMACISIPTSADVDPVESYLASGGDPYRALTKHEAALLNTYSNQLLFEKGQTLMHLALIYSRDDLLAQMTRVAGAKDALKSVASSSNTPSRMRAIKRSPSSVNPERAAQIRRMITGVTRQRKVDTFRVYCIMDFNTFFLPKDIWELPTDVQLQLFDEMLDHRSQKILEEECSAINWSLEICDRLGTRLYAMWNRTQGDCLLDAVLQATYGVFDTDNMLRQALSDSLRDAESVLHILRRRAVLGVWIGSCITAAALCVLVANNLRRAWSLMDTPEAIYTTSVETSFYQRWREHESAQAEEMFYEIDEEQLRTDWAQTVRIASQPGASLEQLHVFALAHIIRRPIVVYAVQYVKSGYDGLPLDFARFEGVYLPLLHEQSICSRSPICLGYTHGHFCALVPAEPTTALADVMASSTGWRKNAYLPLVTVHDELLAVPFIGQNEMKHTLAIMRQWLDVHVTEGGTLTARVTLETPKPLVRRMCQEWLDFYRMLPLANDGSALLSSRRRTSANRVNVSRQRRAVNRIIAEAGDNQLSGDERSQKSSTPSQGEQKSSSCVEGTRNEGALQRHSSSEDEHKGDSA